MFARHGRQTPGQWSLPQRRLGPRCAHVHCAVGQRSVRRLPVPWPLQLVAAKVAFKLHVVVGPTDSGGAMGCGVWGVGGGVGTCCLLFSWGACGTVVQVALARTGCKLLAASGLECTAGRERAAVGDAQSAAPRNCPCSLCGPACRERVQRDPQEGGGRVCPVHSDGEAQARRCWVLQGMLALRADAMAKYGLPPLAARSCSSARAGGGLAHLLVSAWHAHRACVLHTSSLWPMPGLPVACASQAAARHNDAQLPCPAVPLQQGAAKGDVGGVSDQDMRAPQHYSGGSGAAHGWRALQESMIAVLRVHFEHGMSCGACHEAPRQRAYVCS